MKLPRFLSSFALISITLLLFITLPSKAFATGQWTPTGSLLISNITGYQASYGPIVTLQNGKALSPGGSVYSGFPQIYDPSTGQWTFTGQLDADPLNNSRTQLVPITLNNGEVLEAGGINKNSTGCPIPGTFATFHGLSTAELYDPSTNLWTYTENLPVGVANYVVTKLLDGRVMIIGGQYCQTDPPTLTKAVQIYDPSTGHWTRVTDAPKQVTGGNGDDNNVAVLNDGRVLLIGSGNYNNQYTPSAETDLYDPSTGQWARTGDLRVTRFSGNLVKLQDGRVLLTGGSTANGTVMTSDSEIYDPTTGQWTETGALHYGRDGFGSVLLPNGRVLTAGGNDSTGLPILQSEIYDPSTGIWTDDAILNDGHVSANMTLLANEVLIAGGFDSNGNTTTAEIYAFPNNPPVVGSFSAGATINEGDTYSATGSFTDPDSTSWTATVNYGEQGEGDQPLSLNPDKTFSLSHLYKDNQANNAPYTVTVKITDNQGATGTGTATVTVNNVAPTPGAVTISPNPVQINTAVTATANFTDPGVLDTHTATANWGDGTNTATSCSVTEPNGSTPGSVNCTLSSGYSSANVYPVQITVTDANASDGNASGTSPTAYASVYNPTQSSIFTAGERFSNPATASPSTAGNVTFGLSYKYQGSTPTGVREFSMDFNAANIHFNATNISSLVITNGMAILTGTGTKNGSSGYNFLVTGVDGGDIRIQITDSSNNVIYDTQPGDPITAPPTTPVTGHVIVQ